MWPQYVVLALGAGDLLVGMSQSIKEGTWRHISVCATTVALLQGVLYCGHFYDGLFHT